MSSLNDLCAIKVSSVLNRNTRSYGKKFLSDGNDDTCWNSDKGERQWIVFSAEEPFCFHDEDTLSVKIQYQGGFCCATVKTCATLIDGTSVEFSSFHPKDMNAVQEFSICSNQTGVIKVKSIKFTMEDTTDFFGRIIVYHFIVHHIKKES